MSKQNLSLLIRRFTLILPNFFPCRDSCHNLQALAVLPNVGVDVVAPEVAEVEEEVSADVEVVAADSEDEEALADVEVALEDEEEVVVSVDEVVVSVDEVVVAEAVVSVDEDEEDLVLVENIFFYKFCNFLYDFSIQT